jgi:hypothetical protein
MRVGARSSRPRRALAVPPPRGVHRSAIEVWALLPPLRSHTWLNSRPSISFPKPGGRQHLQAGNEAVCTPQDVAKAVKKAQDDGLPLSCHIKRSGDEMLPSRSTRAEVIMLPLAGTSTMSLSAALRSYRPRTNRPAQSPIGMCRCCVDWSSQHLCSPSTERMMRALRRANTFTYLVPLRARAAGPRSRARWRRLSTSR